MPNARTLKPQTTRSGVRRQPSVAQPVLDRADDLGELLDGVASPGSAILVVGVPGSGRSTLLEDVLANSSVRCVWVTPHPWERYQPLAGLSMVLNTIGDPRISKFIPRFTFANPTVDETLATALELLQLLRSGEREETILLIDDADKFDDLTQLTFSYLAGRLAGTGLRMAMVVTPESAYTTFAGIRSVSISRLDGERAMELARAIAPTDADPQTLAMVCDACAGLPGMISSTFAHLTTAQLAGLAPLALPLYPGPAPLDLDSWDPETALLLRRLSTAPLCSLSALPEIRDGNRDRFERLTSQGVLEINGPFVSIRDGALRSTLYWSMTTEQREELHRDAAIEEAGHSNALALWHADHGDNAPEGSKALIAEASELYQQGFVSAATELTERALLLSHGLDGILDQLLALCERLTIVSEFGLARRYLTQCRNEAQEPGQLAECLRLEVTVASLTDESIDVGAVDVYARRIQKNSARISAELLSFASVALATAGDISAARTHIDRAYEIQHADGVAANSVQNWSRRYLDGIDGAGTGPTTKDDANADADDLAISVQLVRGRALMVEEHYDEARHTFHSLALSSPRRTHGSAWTARVLGLSADNEIRSGHFAEASRIIDTLAELAPLQNFRSLLLFAWNEAVVYDRPTAEPLLAEARDRAMQLHQPILSAKLLALEGSLALMRGDLDEARFRLARAYESTLDLRPDYLRVEGDFIEVLARRDEWDAARRVTARFAERAAQYPSRWSDTVLAGSRAIVAPDDQLLRAFQQALTIAKDDGAGFENARGRLNFAFALERFGQGQHAREQRQTAEFMFETLSAAGWARAVRDSAATIEPLLENSLLSSLTESELAVLRLMRKGLRNKDIAGALFVSLRTVEVRITQIYRKLEARSRSHLLTLLPADIDQIESF
ncbi:MAG: ATPase-like protein [Glaciihabitans sp.]|nr:ATPase-like protein [Glaciihabitans sp.]